MGQNVYISKEFIRRAIENIEHSKEFINVMMFEWVWYSGQRAGTIQDVNRAVCRASQRGVKVRVVLSNEAKGRHLGKLNRATMGRLQRNGCEVRLQPMQRMVHAKVWIFDGTLAMLGSHNMSQRAVTSNIEVGCEVNGGADLAKLMGLFEELWAVGIGHPLDRAE